ncbi:oxamate carbamoyltransferase subunit AllG family protein [Monashia sp. NPDC004114]
MADHLERRTGAYFDSVSLMQVSRAVAMAAGVEAAQVAMATELNLELIAAMGFAVPADAGPNDLLIAIRGSDDGVANGRAALDEALASMRTAAAQTGGLGDAPPAHTLGGALRASGANVALVSVPGEFAATEAFDAVRAGVSVMVFSDNVPTADEVRLKDAASRAGVLVMGPDCGTAVVAGAALGFANVVRPGPVGLVAASGTGAQQVMCLLDAAGVGISHCLGVGGRDLSSAVGGRSTRQALAALAADPATERIVVVSKPPAAEVLSDIESYAAALGKPVSWATLGPGRADLTAAVEGVVGRAQAWPQWRGASSDEALAAPGRALRGLFCGGTLADEAMLIAAGVLGDIRSNTPLRPDLALGHDLLDQGHVVIDFGDDSMTRGRAHPMIDPTLRIERIGREAADPTCGVLLLDLVLGHGAHPDPAPELADAIRAARETAQSAGRNLPVVVSVTGTTADPQGLERSAGLLMGAGATVMLSNAEATRHALELLGHTPPEASDTQPASVADGTAYDTAHETAYETAYDGTASPAGDSLHDLLVTEPTVASAGVSLFAESLRAQAVPVTEAAWQPPMPGTSAALARVLGDERRDAANAEALRRMLAAGADLVDVRPAAAALGLESGTFLHAGPPITFDRASGPLRGALIGAMLFEGLADTPEEAQARLERGDGITLEPCHHRDAVGPMAGVISPSMWVYELRDEVHDNTSWCSLNEGLGKVLRYGAYGPEVIDRLRWMNSVLGPILQQAVRARVDRSGAIDIKAIIAQMLQMGDEGHNRNRAGSLMLLRELLPTMITADASSTDIAEAVRFSGANEHFFLNLGMPACKLSTLAAHGIPGSSVVTTMARNGTDFGIRVSGTGDEWFTGPANTPEGLFLGSYGPEDANPDIGDSAITETGGIGGFAMAAAPAIVRFVGGDVPFALRATQTMYEITVGEHTAYQVPILEFRGTPTGIDVAAVARTGILPQINTGMAGKVAGTGQVGAGLVTPPQECFTQALATLAGLVPA